MSPRLSGNLLLRWDLPCHETKQSNWRKQKFTSTQIQFFVWERCRSIQKPMNGGKITLNISNIPTNTKLYLESLENQLRSSGIVSHDTEHCRFSRRFKTTWQLVKQVQKNLKTESSSCLCSTTSIIEKRNSEKGSRITQEGSSLDIGHSSVPKKKTNGMEHTMTNLKESGILLPMSL